MADSTKWRDGVRVVRAASLESIMRAPNGTGRATAFDFALNLSASETVEFLVVRSDNEKIAVNLDVSPVEQPETVS